MNEAKLGGGGRNRTYGVSDVTDLQSAAFAARHTPPLIVNTLSAMLFDTVKG